MNYRKSSRYASFGNFLGKKLEGFGVRALSGVVIGCVFRNGKLVNGIQRWSNGDQYIGEFKEGQRNGRGKFIWKNGTTYEGQFINDEIHGLGSKLFEDTSTYVGDFRNNLFWGLGTYVWPDGKQYQGHFVAGQFHGVGVLTLKDGKVFEGNWKEDKWNGKHTRNSKKNEADDEYGVILDPNESIKQSLIALNYEWTGDYELALIHFKEAVK